MLAGDEKDANSVFVNPENNNNDTYEEDDQDENEINILALDQGEDADIENIDSEWLNIC